MASLTPWPVRAEQGCTNHRRALAPRPPPPIASSTSNAFATLTRIQMCVSECVRAHAGVSEQAGFRVLAAGSLLRLHALLSENTRARQRGESSRTAAT